MIYADVSRKQPVEQLFTGYFEVVGHIGEDSRERSDSERIVLRNREMMLAMLLRR